MIRSALALALRYLAASPGRTGALTLGAAVALALPLFTRSASATLQRALLARAEASPILIGHVGDEVDLVLNALYFESEVRDPIPYGARRAAAAYGAAVPLYVAHSASGAPVVGAGLEYLELRGLSVAEGRAFAQLGEVIAGAEAARAFNLEVGDTVRSDLANLYNIAGAYPVMLEVVGLLEPTGGPDDGAFFTDVKTIWVLDGALHGHDAVTRDQALNPDAAEEEGLEASLAVFTFAEIDDRNIDRFHLHGDPDALPVSSILVFPADDRRRDQLLGDYALEPLHQAVIPTEVIREILGVALQIQSGLEAYFAAVAASTTIFFGLVISLSLRLRRRELALMRRIGSSRGAIGWIVAAEIGLVLAAAAALALALDRIGVALLESALR